MRDNITKVAERGERLDSLESKTGILLILCHELTLPLQTTSQSQHKDSDVVQIVSENRCGGKYSLPVLQD
jgi:hypothetical protein